MKDSIAYLPKDKQEELNFLVTEILRRLPQTEFIILYGSYARGNYVRRSIRIEDGGIPTVKISDYDIYVITSGINSKKAETILDNVEDIFFAGKDFDRDTPVEFINDDISKLNSDLSEGRYFYTEIKREGILLYDSGKHKLARRRKLHYDEIKQQAEEYYNEKLKNAKRFFETTKFHYDQEWYKLSAFDLHQTCENLFYAARLTYTLRNSKQHNLAKLLSSVRKYSPEFSKIFPNETKEEKRLFKLLKSAYVEARYNSEFEVTKEDIDTLRKKVTLLFDLIERICCEQINEYQRRHTLHITGDSSL